MIQLLFIQRSSHLFPKITKCTIPRVIAYIAGKITLYLKFWQSPIKYSVTYYRRNCKVNFQ